MVDPILAWWLANMFVGLLIGDFLTGIFHWWEDTYCTFNVGGWLGNNICHPNLVHHKDQAAFTKSSFWQINYIQFLGAAPFVIFFGYFQIYTLMFAAIFAAFGNQVHVWCHKKTNLPFVPIMQKAGWLQNPEHHAEHHKLPHDKHYCVLTNFMNPLLESLDFWRNLEALILATTKIAPKRHENNLELTNLSKQELKDAYSNKQEGRTS